MKKLISIFTIILLFIPSLESYAIFGVLKNAAKSAKKASKTVDKTQKVSTKKHQETSRGRNANRLHKAESAGSKVDDQKISDRKLITNIFGAARLTDVTTRQLVNVTKGFGDLNQCVISSGGIGIIHNKKLLNSALSFSTERVFDCTILPLSNTYEYHNLVEQSEQLTTLPVYLNILPHTHYKELINELGNSDKVNTLSNINYQKVINKALEELSKYSEQPSVTEKVKLEYLLSVLYFVSNDYINAKEYSERAINDIYYLKIESSLPLFIFATSSLYQENFNFNSVTNNFFKNSIIKNTEYSLTPLFFSIYLDRMMLRFNDGYLNDWNFNNIFLIIKSDNIRNHQLQNYITLISRYFIRLKLEQQRISSIAYMIGIKDNKKTTQIVNDSLIKYKHLLELSGLVMKEMLMLSDNLNDENQTKISDFQSLWDNYHNDLARLEVLANRLKANH